MSENDEPPTAPHDSPGAYEPPAILWEEELPQGPNVFSACGKIGGTGELCNSAPGS
jgi:hypothetical protein